MLEDDKKEELTKEDVLTSEGDAIESENNDLDDELPPEDSDISFESKDILSEEDNESDDSEFEADMDLDDENLSSGNDISNEDEVLENDSDVSIFPGQNIEEEDLSTDIKNTFITVAGEKYAVGLFWQPLQDPDDAIGEIQETIDTASEGGNLYCIRMGSTPQYAIGISGDIKAGMKVAAASVADAFSDKPSSVAVFKVEEGWWFLTLRSDLILAEDDRLYTNEDDAKKAFLEMMAVPDWGRKIAPPEWGIDGTSYIDIVDILKNTASLKLMKLDSSRNMKNIWILVGVVLFLLLGVYKLIDLLSAPPPMVYKPIPKIQKKAPPPPPPEAPAPWTSLTNPVDVLNKCHIGIKEQELIAIPGWEISNIVCNVSGNTASVSAEWNRKNGRISWFSGALKTLGISQNYKVTVSDSGQNGRISSQISGLGKINSEPTLSQKDIKLEMIDIFDVIGIKIALASVTEGNTIDPKNPNAPPKPKYYAVMFKYSTEYDPENWVDVLPKFKALTIENVIYNVKNNNWSYEGKIYERRN